LRSGADAGTMSVAFLPTRKAGGADMNSTAARRPSGIRPMRYCS